MEHSKGVLWTSLTNRKQKRGSTRKYVAVWCSGGTRRKGRTLRALLRVEQRVKTPEVLTRRGLQTATCLVD